MTILAATAIGCSGAAPEDVGATESALVVRGPVVPPVTPIISTIYVGDGTDRLTVLGEAAGWFDRYFYPAGDDGDRQDAAAYQATFLDPTTPPEYWGFQAKTSALVEMYDLVLPLDPARAQTYLNRLHALASAALELRDDHRVIPPIANVARSAAGNPIDAFRGHVMAAWGAVTVDRDGKWNTDAVTTGFYVYAMSAFARRVADNPALQGQAIGAGGPTYAAEALRFIGASIESYQAFRPEMHYTSDPEAYFNKPQAYASLSCTTNMTDDQKYNCAGYRREAGRPLAWNENLSMMKGLADLALACNSSLFLNSSPDFALRWLALLEAPVFVARNVKFFNDHLFLTVADDGTVVSQWHPELDNTGRVQDVSHANFELGLYEAIYEDKPRLDALLAANGFADTIPITLTNIALFAETFLHRVVVVNGGTPWFHDAIDGSGHTPSKNLEAASAGFTSLTKGDPWTWVRCQEAAYETASDGSLPHLNVANHAALMRYKADRW